MTVTYCSLSASSTAATNAELNVNFP